MLRVYAEHYVSIGQTIEQLTPQYIHIEVYPPRQLTPTQAGFVLDNLRIIKTHCDQLELAVSSQFLEYYVRSFSENIPFFNDVKSCLENFQIAFYAELRKRLFVFVPPHFAGAFEQEALFGEEVNRAFPSATRDIREAGTCLALGLGTACVFHSMRVLEHGLRALAEALGLTFSVEQWLVIIKQIESKICALENLPKSQQRIRDQEFYSGAAKNFRYFKDAWRNHVMHGKEHYDEREANTVLEHVNDFMTHLSTRLKEKSGIVVDSANDANAKGKAAQ